MKLLADEKTNAKLAKSSGSEYYTVGLPLAPASLSGHNVCRNSTAACRAACIGWHSGQNVMATAKRSKLRKTQWFFDEPWAFIAQLKREIRLAEIRAVKAGKVLAVRLNAYSDIHWEKLAPELFTTFPGVQFYDYTKIPGRITPLNYHLTFSYSGTVANRAHCWHYLEAGGTVAVVGTADAARKIFPACPIVDGDQTDLRFLDPPGAVVVLKPKGPLARKGIDNSTNPFVA